MLSGQDIVCFSPNPWHALWRNRQQIMSRLAQQNRVLFVEPAPYLRQSTARARQEGVRTLRPPHLQQVLPQLWTYSPSHLAPRAGRRPLEQLTFLIRLHHLRRTLARLHMQAPLLWIFQYDLGEMIGRLGERLVIYHAIDEYSAYYNPGNDGAARRERIRRLESELIGRADLVFVTSPALLESKRRLHPHVVMVPNAVDYDLFAHPSGPAAELNGMPHPIVGYAGVINEKLDFDLLLALAGRRPGWQFVLIGPDALQYERDRLEALRALPNVHLLGQQPVESLPAYVAGCDVCLIPYRLNEWTRNISPLKLYEYLAAGVPVVATPIPAVREFASVLWLAASADEFVQAIEAALDGHTPERRAREQALAAQHTWDHRIAALSAAIQERLAAGS